MHFDFNLRLGDVLTIVTVLGVGLRFHTAWVRMTEQHGLMWRWYQKVHRMNGEPEKVEVAAGD